jgi:hypothetical protein
MRVQTLTTVVQGLEAFKTAWTLTSPPIGGNSIQDRAMPITTPNKGGRPRKHSPNAARVAAWRGCRSLSPKSDARGQSSHLSQKNLARTLATRGIKEGAAELGWTTAPYRVGGPYRDSGKPSAERSTASAISEVSETILDIDRF